MRCFYKNLFTAGALALAIVGTTAASAATTGSDEASHGYLGITGMKCNCTLTESAEGGERMWYFRAEPTILQVDPDGPTANVLEPGDVIVAVDDLLITTRRGGRRFANVTAGEPVKLTIRRDERIVTVKVVPEPSPPEESKIIHGLAEPSKLQVLRLDELSKSLETLAIDSDVLVVENSPDDTYMLQLDATSGVAIIPDGWFGLGIECGGCIVQKKEYNGESVRWHFESPPTVHSVERNGPADRAGLRPGDLLTHIDGVPLDTREGGRRFSSVVPGQKVVWTVVRNEDELEIEMEAETRPASQRPRVLGDKHELRFSGAVGGADLRVLGNRRVQITHDEESGEVIITTRDATIRVRDAGGED